jgi:site-specific DNA recombinase
MDTSSLVLTYERVSTDDQAQTKSCDDQKSVNDKYILSQGWRLADNADYRDEGISGSSLDRPGLQELLIRCEQDQNIKAVVITESDRIARGNLAYLFIREALKKCGVRMVAVTQPMIDDSDEGEMIGEIMGAVNGFLSRITRRKSMRAADERAARGWYPTKAPLGYINVNIGTEEKPERVIQVNEEKAVYVRQIPRMYNQGLSYNDISIELSRQGFRTNSNRNVTQEHIRQILFSDFYLGEFYWRGKQYKGNHPPLFSYIEVQNARSKSHEKGHIHTSNPTFKDKFIFKKLNFYCASCKNLRVTAECKVKHYPKTNRTAEYIFYHCTKSNGGWKNCDQPSINRSELINQLAIKAVAPIDIDQDLAEFLLEELDKEYTRNKENRLIMLSNANKRLGQIDTELTNLFEMRISGKIHSTADKTSDDIYEEYRQKKEHERKSLLVTKNKLEDESFDLTKKASNFFSLCCDATNKFLDATEEKQFNFVKAITSNVLLDNKELIVTHQSPFDVLAKWDRISLGSPT